MYVLYIYSVYTSMTIQGSLYSACCDVGDETVGRHHQRRYEQVISHNRSFFEKVIA